MLTITKVHMYTARSTERALVCGKSIVQGLETTRGDSPEIPIHARSASVLSAS